jgi:beta-glucosidase
MSNPRYKNPHLPIADRVVDLMMRMTPEEKARQLDMFMGADVMDKMRHYTRMALDGRVDPARAAATIGEQGCGVIHDLYPVSAEAANELQRWFCQHTRLGIPALLVEEALHGFGRPGSTVFPQCIGLGATFDFDLVERVGAAIAAEMRAVGVHLALSPVLCLARDPRWGRAEETFGEDPWLAGEMGRAYVTGMQGDLGPLNVVAEPKHFAGHGSPQGGLNQGPAHYGEREFREVMLRPFEPAFTDAGALGAMCAYHEIDGIPCAANRWLLTDVLRDEWGFEGVVISDLGAIRQLLDKHLVAKDARDAICQALRAGVDIQFYDFDHATWMCEIAGAVRDGDLDPKVLDSAVARVLALKFRLGLFDQPETEPSLNARVCRSRAHLDLSLEAARKSLVLLKNEGGLLPLKPGIRRIAVLGPSADVVRLGDYSGVGDGMARPMLDWLREFLPDTEIIHRPGVDTDRSDLDPLPQSWISGPDGVPGLRGEYFGSGQFGGSPDVVRQDERIDFNWANALAAPGLPADQFAVRWTGLIVPCAAHAGTLDFVTADFVRVWLDGELVIDAWNGGHNTPATHSTPIDWGAGQQVELRIEWCKRGGGSVVLLGLGKARNGFAEAVASAADAEVAILALGESDRTSGEGIDRCELGLPGRQEELFRAVIATGTPVIVVLQNGRALSVPDIAVHAQAVVEAWFPGELGGRAIAEALVGMVNPGGRMPVSVARHVGQLPLTYDRKPSRQGRYVELDGEPLWEFGFGLSYTTFAYSDLMLAAEKIGPSDALEISCTVENTGDREGDEVAQLYLTDLVASVTRPIRWLAGCQRLTLKSGEKRRVVFEIGPCELRLWSREGRWVVEPGEFRVTVGGGQDGPLRGAFQVVRPAAVSEEEIVYEALSDKVAAG